MSRIRPLLALLVVLLLAAPALAISADPDGAPSVPSSALIEVLCAGDECGGLDLPDADMGFDYVFGGRTTTGGLHLDVSATGSIFVLGPLRADTIVLDALHVELGPIDFDFDFELPRIDDPPYGDICGCITTEGGDITLVAAVTGQDPEPPSPLSWTASFHGDVYLDMADLLHASVRLFAKNKIVIVNDPTNPVPEPGTGLLMGLGLAGLAGIRRDAR